MKFWLLLTYSLNLFFLHDSFALNCEKIIPIEDQNHGVFELGRYKANYKVTIFDGTIDGILCAANPGDFESFSDDNFKFYYKDSQNHRVKKFSIIDMLSIDRGVTILHRDDLISIFKTVAVKRIVNFKLERIVPFGNDKALIDGVFDFAIKLSSILSKTEREKIKFQAIFDFQTGKVEKVLTLKNDQEFKFKNFEFAIRGAKIKSLDFVDKKSRHRMRF